MHDAINFAHYFFLYYLFFKQIPASPTEVADTWAELDVAADLERQSILWSYIDDVQSSKCLYI